jgi:hemerythrin-like domain-containing protein
MASKTKGKAAPKPLAKKAPAKKAPAKKAPTKAAQKNAKKSAPAKKAAPRAKAVKNDIVEIILQDHKPLKRLIKILTSEKSIADKRRAYEEFAPLLAAHSKPEEQSMYAHMHEKEELNGDAYEGETEHDIAEQLISDIESLATDEEDEWEAKVKVLGELVEHHIEEEEEEMLPELKKELTDEERSHIGEEFLRLKAEGVGGEEE